jgi:hypothetical protein
LSSVIAKENASFQQQTPDPVNAELVALRERVAKLETDLALQRALADERANSLEQLHLTFRKAITAGESEPKKRGLFRRK